MVPLLVAHALSGSTASLKSLVSFLVIGAGALGCVAGGWLSARLGSARVAFVALSASGAMCILYPVFGPRSGIFALCLLVAWGMVVVADSPQFSSLSAQACPPDQIGSALAMQNAIGFSITIVSIWLVTAWAPQLGLSVCWLLVPGPVLGLFAMRGLVFSKKH
jgi:MFS family permease